MNEESNFFQVPESVKEDTGLFRERVEKYLRGETTPVSFRAYRVPRGIYEQRQEGTFMVRVRIPAGVVLPHQMLRLAELSRTYGNGILHLTTRQDIQIHGVQIENTPDVLVSLLEAGLSPRGGGGNTVRNVTACPRAGVSASEVFDVRPYAIALTEYLLQYPSSFNLPRKFKVVFSGCSRDCALASVADLGFFAHVKNGSKGFSVYAGGGLGPNSRVGIKIEEFVEAGDVFRVAEAMKRLFDKHGDRTNKRRARLRYVLARLGPEEFVRLYREHRAMLQGENLPTPAIRPVPSASRRSNSEKVALAGELASEYEIWRRTSVQAEKAEDQFTIRLRPALGDIPADDMERIASLASRVGEGLARTTHAQNILLCRVHGDDLPFVFSELRGLDVDVMGGAVPELVVCAGASTCKLGLCKSRDLANAISAELAKSRWPADYSSLAVRISGCPNSCGQHHIGTLGLQGLAKRVRGKLVPCYAFLCGAVSREGEARLADEVGVVPARKVPALMRQVLSLLAAKHQDIDSAISDCTLEIKKLVEAHSDIPSAEEDPDICRDFGDEGEFSLAGRGPGECGAGVMDVIQLDIDEAKQAVAAARDCADAKGKSDAIYKAVVAGARALLITRGIEPRKEREIFAAFDEHIIRPGWVAAESKDLLAEALDYRLGDIETLTASEERAAEMVARVEELFRSLDANLDFGVEPFAAKDSTLKAEETSGHVVDLRGVACPMNFVKAKLALEKIPVGEVLEIQLDDGEPVRNVPASFADQGQDVLDVTKSGEHFKVKVKRLR
ncbi:MAG: sulfurtransferase TusA family protein [Planctomycetia bacterium]|nr:sulfurtransferase TusA family protein [Planctomycetia bacterium]